ncbi:RidA family protein [Planctomycetota bacterium]|nr:RidA family protein [Planctomycetota bacterium]
MPRSRVTSKTRWENDYAYCRAIKAGRHIFVSGTAPVTDDGQTFAPNDPFTQTKRCLEIAIKAIQELGGELKDIVRTRMYVMDISQSDAHGRAHGEVFKVHPPCCTMVEISKLIAPDMTIEIEVEAVLDA